MKTYDEIKSSRRLKCALVLFFVLLLFGSASYVTAAPVANFSSNPTLGTVPLSVQFMDTSIGGPMVNWTWNYQDGTPIVTVPNPTHLFETAGEFPVSLLVWNATESSSMTHFVNVSPLAQFTATPVTGYAPLSVQFTDTSLGNPDNWTWQFGDQGNISNVKSPSYTFYRSGVYTVNLTSKKNFMSNQSANMTITVNPKADFTITPSTGFASTTSFQFNASASTGNPVGYVWSFEAWNQSWSGPAVLNKTFDTANTYTIRLTVNGNGGTSDSTTRALPVYPVAIFTANPPNIVEGRPVSFDGTASKGNLTSSPTGTWSWNFGDNTPTVTGNTTTHIFVPGRFTVTLTVTKNGLSNSTTTTIFSDSGNLYLLRSGINGNTYFRASKYGIHPFESIQFNAYSTRSVYSLGSGNRPVFRPDTNTTYKWEFIGAYDPTNHYINTGPLTSPSLSQEFRAADIYTVRLTVTDSRDTYTVTKPRLIVVRA
jgi:PKD repeat protein